jgi:soluble lytic murein transglycosylase-like protein
MLFQPKPFFKGMLAAIIPVALVVSFKSNKPEVVREKITPEAAMTVSLSEADFLLETWETHTYNKLEFMRLKSLNEDGPSDVVAVERENKINQEKLSRVNSNLIPIVSANEVQLETYFDAFSKEYGVSKEVLKTIAYCESGIRPQATNGPYGGMFQFTQGTWISNRKAMGLEPNPNLRFDAREAIKTAAFKISRDGVSAWPVCGKRALAAAET